jgi:hypothetical protein
MPIWIVRILGAPICAHAAHFFCATGAPSRNTRILKNRPKMPSQGSVRPSFGRFLGSSTQCRRCHLFPRADMGTRCTCILQNIRGEATSSDLKESAQDALGGPKYPPLLPILRFPRFRAHAAHAFAQRRRRRAGQL